MKPFFLSAAIVLCTGMAASAQSPQLVDRQAEKNTRQVYQFLLGIENEGKVLIGHQDDLAYGVGWKDVKGGSDVKGCAATTPPFTDGNSATWNMRTPYKTWIPSILKK